MAALGEQILFFFSGLGVFNGFLISMYFLFFAKPKRLPNQFFGLLLLALCIRIGKSVLYFFERELPKEVLQFGLSACLFIGPFLYFYIRSIQITQQHSKGFHRLWTVHVGLLALVMIGVGILFPYNKRPDLWNPEIVQGIYAVWVLYVIATGYELREEGKKVYLGQYKDLSVHKMWLFILWATNALICLVYNSILYLGVPSYIWGPITFSFIFYGLWAFLLFFPNSFRVINGEDIHEPKDKDKFEEKHTQKKYAHKRIPAQQAYAIHLKLEQLMTEQHLYQQPNLKLKDVAEKLELTPHILSQFLNDNLGISYSDFVNSYRVKSASERLRLAPHLTIEAIGEEVGFRSKSSFYLAFKKVHKLTPHQYLKSLP